MSTTSVGMVNDKVAERVRKVLMRAGEITEEGGSFVLVELMDKEDADQLASGAGLLLGMIVATGEAVRENEREVQKLTQAAEVMIHVADSWYSTMHEETPK